VAEQFLDLTKVLAENNCMRVFRPIFLLVLFGVVFFSAVHAKDSTIRCDYCGEPIVGDYIVVDSHPYHFSCYENHVALRCAVCGQIIKGEYYVDFWGNAVHAYHKGVEPQCEYCGRYISDYTTGGGFRYDDGRIICKLCEKTAVEDSATVDTIRREIIEKFRSIGINLKDDNPPISLVDKTTMARLDDDHIDPNGYTYIEKTTSLGVTLEKHLDIFLLHGMPRLHVVATLAHELMHVWLYDNGPDDMDPALCEGSCNYAAYLVLKQYPGKMSEYIQTTFRDEPDSIYGDGFRQVAKYAEKHGVREWLSYLKSHRRLPR
jgi:hypothetical protein